jgi:hypothetical protein
MKLTSTTDKFCHPKFLGSATVIGWGSFFLTAKRQTAGHVSNLTSERDA